MDVLGQLMMFARDGDRDAFAEIMRISADSVQHFVRHTAGGLDTDDIMQDTYLRLWSALPRFRGDSAGMTYILGIARRATIDELRRSQRRQRITRSVHLIDVHSDIGEAHAIESLVQSLNDQRREAFVLTQIMGMSYDEAATIAGVPVGTIRSRVARAREDLAAQYRPTGSE